MRRPALLAVAFLLSLGCTPGPDLADVNGPLADLTPADTLGGPPAGLQRIGSVSGVPFGFTGLPSDLMCGSPVSTGTVVPGNPSLIGGLLRKAERCGFHVIVRFRRADMTQGGKTGSTCTASGCRFSVDNALAYEERLHDGATDDEWGRWTANGTLWALGSADDMACAQCYGGVQVTQREVAAVVERAHALWPTTPIEVRGEASWAAGDPGAWSTQAKTPDLFTLQ
jgi:hypothetical protein